MKIANGFFILGMLTVVAVGSDIVLNNASTLAMWIANIPISIGVIFLGLSDRISRLKEVAARMKDKNPTRIHDGIQKANQTLFVRTGVVIIAIAAIAGVAHGHAQFWTITVVTVAIDGVACLIYIVASLECRTKLRKIKSEPVIPDKLETSQPE